MNSESLYRQVTVFQRQKRRCSGYNQSCKQTSPFVSKIPFYNPGPGYSKTYSPTRSTAAVPFGNVKFSSFQSDVASTNQNKMDSICQVEQQYRTQNSELEAENHQLLQQVSQLNAQLATVKESNQKAQLTLTTYQTDTEVDKTECLKQQIQNLMLLRQEDLKTIEKLTLQAEGFDLISQKLKDSETDLKNTKQLLLKIEQQWQQLIDIKNKELSNEKTSMLEYVQQLQKYEKNQKQQNQLFDKISSQLKLQIHDDNDLLEQLSLIITNKESLKSQLQEINLINTDLSQQLQRQQSGSVVHSSNEMAEVELEELRNKVVSLEATIVQLQSAPIPSKIDLQTMISPDQLIKGISSQFFGKAQSVENLQTEGAYPSIQENLFNDSVVVETPVFQQELINGNIFELKQELVRKSRYVDVCEENIKKLEEQVFDLNMQLYTSKEHVSAQQTYGGPNENEQVTDSFQSKVAQLLKTENNQELIYSALQNLIQQPVKDSSSAAEKVESFHRCSAYKHTENISVVHDLQSCLPVNANQETQCEKTPFCDEKDILISKLKQKIADLEEKMNRSPLPSNINTQTGLKAVSSQFVVNLQQAADAQAAELPIHVRLCETITRSLRDESQVSVQLRQKSLEVQVLEENAQQLEAQIFELNMQIYTLNDQLKLKENQCLDLQRLCVELQNSRNDEQIKTQLQLQTEQIQLLKNENQTLKDDLNCFKITGLIGEFHEEEKASTENLDDMTDVVKSEFQSEPQE